MYSLCFYLCLGASLALIIILVLLAIFPLNLPLVSATAEPTLHRPKKARSPTAVRSYRPTYQDLWDDDEADL